MPNATNTTVSLIQFFTKIQRKYAETFRSQPVFNVEKIIICPKVSITEQTTNPLVFLSGLRSDDSGMLQIPQNLLDIFEILADWFALTSFISKNCWKNPILNLLIHGIYFCHYSELNNPLIQHIINQVVSEVSKVYQNNSGGNKDPSVVRNECIHVLTRVPYEIVITKFINFIEPNAPPQLIIADYIAFLLAWISNIVPNSHEIKQLFDVFSKIEKKFIVSVNSKALCEAVPSLKNAKKFSQFQSLLTKYHYAWEFHYNLTYMRLMRFRLMITFPESYLGANANANFISFIDKFAKISFISQFCALSRHFWMYLSIPEGLAPRLEQFLMEQKRKNAIQAFHLMQVINQHVQINFNFDSSSESFSFLADLDSAISYNYSPSEFSPINEELTIIDIMKLLPSYLISYNLDFNNPENNFTGIYNRLKIKYTEWKAKYPHLKREINDLLFEINSLPSSLGDYYFRAWRSGKIRIDSMIFLMSFFIHNTKVSYFNLLTHDRIEFPFLAYNIATLKNPPSNSCSCHFWYDFFVDVKHVQYVFREICTGQKKICGIRNGTFFYNEMADIIHLWNTEQKSWDLALFEAEFADKFTFLPGVAKAKINKHQFHPPESFFSEKAFNFAFDLDVLNRLETHGNVILQDSHLLAEIMASLFSYDYPVSDSVESWLKSPLLPGQCEKKKHNRLPPAANHVSVFIYIGYNSQNSQNPITPQLIWSLPEFSALFSIGLQEVYFWPNFEESWILLEYRVPDSAIGPKGQFTRMIRKFEQYDWDFHVFEVHAIQQLFNEPAILSGDWHYAEFLNFSPKREVSPHPIMVMNLTDHLTPPDANRVVRFSYSWQFWQCLTYVFEYCIWIPVKSVAIAEKVKVLINEMELGFAYYLAEKQTSSDSSGSPSSPSSPNSPDAQKILVICRYNRNCLKLIDILKRKLAELGILLNLSSAITFSELYPDHPLSHFIHQSQLYSTNPQNAEILFPIFTTNRSIMYSPADQLILYQCLEDLGESPRKSTLLRIHQIASELKMAGKLTFAALKDAVIEARQNLSGVVQKNSEPLI